MTTFEKRVATGPDDGFISTPLSSFDNNDDGFSFGNAGGFSGSVSAFVRFTDVTVPSRVVVTYAYVRFTDFQQELNVTVDVDVNGELATNPVAAFSNADFVARNRTVASINWQPGPWEIGEEHDTPDIKTLIQEIIDQPGWTSGNSIQIFIEDNSSDTDAVRQPRAYDGLPSEASQLHIEYDIATPPQFPTVTKIGPSADAVVDALADPHVEFIPGPSPEQGGCGQDSYTGLPRCRWTYPNRLLTGEEFYQLKSLVGDNPSADVIIDIPTQTINLSTYTPVVSTYSAIMHWPEEDVRVVRYNKWEMPDDGILFTQLIGL